MLHFNRRLTLETIFVSDQLTLHNKEDYIDEDFSALNCHLASFTTRTFSFFDALNVANVPFHFDITHNDDFLNFDWSLSNS